MRKNIILYAILLIIILSGYFILSLYFSNNTKILKKKIEEKNQLINQLKKELAISEIPFYLNKEAITIKAGNEKYELTKFETNLLPYGKGQGATGSSYIDYFDKKLFLVSGAGKFAYINIDEFNKKRFAKNWKENIDEFHQRYVKFLTIPSNIREIVSHEDFYKSSKFGIKDLFIHNKKIYVSLTNQMNQDCFNTAIYVSDLNINQLKFKNFFTPETCVNINNTYGEFEAHQSGGRMHLYKNNKIIFSHGEYRFRDHAQNKNNLFGKIFSIDLNSKKTEIISMGHRNPQGLFYDIDDDVIFSTEHGPLGGDEINNNIQPGDKLKNYGWPISSYGDHYGHKTWLDPSDPKYKKAPLHKSHKDYGFIEPLIYYNPSIGISQLIKIPATFNGIKNVQYFVTSMGVKERFKNNQGDMSIHHFQFNKNYTISAYNILPIGERIRDIIYIKDINKIFLFLESTASIGIFELLVPQEIN